MGKRRSQSGRLGIKSRTGGSQGEVRELRNLMVPILRVRVVNKN